MSDTSPTRPPPPPSDAKLAAMVSLLSDPDEHIVESVAAAMEQLDVDVAPLLEAELAHATGPYDRRLRSVLAQVRHPDADARLAAHLAGEPELEQGALLIARLVDGGPEPDTVAATLDDLAEQVAAARGRDEDPVRGFDTLSRVLGASDVLRPLSPDAANPSHALLHGALGTAGGMPLPLCMVWILVARRVGVRLVGSGMPGHFLLRLPLPDGSSRMHDAFRRGSQVTWRSCRAVLGRYGMAPTTPEALDADDRAMLLRTLRNVMHLARAVGDRKLHDRAALIFRGGEQRGLR